MKYRELQLVLKRLRQEGKIDQKFRLNQKRELLLAEFNRAVADGLVEPPESPEDKVIALEAQVAQLQKELLAYKTRESAKSELDVLLMDFVIQNDAKYCVLSNVEFNKNNPCEIHHIEGQSEAPEFADDPKNLIPLTSTIHRAYHSWVSENELDISRATLKSFAKTFGYRTDLDISRNEDLGQNQQGIQLDLMFQPR